MARRKHKIRTDSDFDWDIRVMHKEKAKGSNRRQMKAIKYQQKKAKMKQRYDRDYW